MPPAQAAPELAALLRQAWGEHVREPARLVALGEQIVQAAQAPGLDAAQAQVYQAWGWLQQAWGQRFRGQVGAADAALAHAKALFSACAHAPGLASCRDIEAMALGLQRRWQEALALLADNDAVPSAQRSPFERFCTHQRRAWLLDQQGDREAALRERYVLLAVARESADDALVAHALGSLGGMHADLFDLEAADQLCAHAVALAEGCQAFQAWSIAALNRLNALVALGRGAQGLALSQALQAAEPRLNQRAREQRCIVHADVLQQSGLHSQAQALLEESRRLRHTGSESLLSWTVVRVACLLAEGVPAQARAEGEAWLAQPDVGTDPALLPAEWLRLLRSLALACEAVVDLAGALRYQRQAFELHERLVGRSARARRLALEIEHQLDRERWQREQAEQRERAAEAERLRLDQLNHALEAANAAKTRFLAAASHDLRQPVQALALNMAALEHEALSPGQAMLVQRMGRSLQALVQMFDVLLDISRLDAGVVAVALQPVALVPLTRRLFDELAPAAQARGLAWRLRVPLEVEKAEQAEQAVAWTDPVLLERLLRNLMDNALKYTRQGGVLVALRRRQGQWLLQVHDTGLGMRPEVLARVFDEFYQADNPERDRVQGLGLGLAIVQRLAGLLKHGLQLCSQAGRGTTAALRLPASTALPPLVADGQPGYAAAPAQGVLAVVDDDADVRDGLVALLRRWGWQVLDGVDDAAVLRAWHAQGRPRVEGIVCDLRLRNQRSGVQAVAALRAAWRASCPALVVSGDVAPDRLQLLQASGLPWLPKPVMPMRLRSWLAGLPSGD